MKRYLLLCLLLSPVITRAQVIDTLKASALLSAGAGASFLVHESGHQIAAWGTGSPMAWGWDGTWATTNTDHLKIIALSGWTAQGLGAEALLAFLPRDNAFLLGYENYYVWNTAQYIIRSALTSGGFEDFSSFPHSERALISTALAAHIFLVGWRIFQPNSVPKFIRTTGDRVDVAFNW